MSAYCLSRQRMHPAEKMNQDLPKEQTINRSFGSLGNCFSRLKYLVESTAQTKQDGLFL